MKLSGPILILCLLLIFSLNLAGYTPDDALSGPVKSIRTFKQLLRPIPAGTREEPWFLNIDYDEKGRTLTQWYYTMGQESRRHEFRYEALDDGREKTTWVTFYITPDFRPPLERLAGYEHWYTLHEGDDQSEWETRFETVQNHPVKSVYRFYNKKGFLVHESDTMADLDIDLEYDEKDRLIQKKGYIGQRIFWQDQYFYDDKDRLIHVVQSDLNKQLYQREDYDYEDSRVVFNKYLLNQPFSLDRDDLSPLENPWFRSIKSYDSQNRLILLENYHWNGPMGLILTEKQEYTYNEKNQLISVEEIYAQKKWHLTYDAEGNWITLEYRDNLNSPGKITKWTRVIEYIQN